MPDEYNPDFFISYSSADTRWAEWVAWHLEEAGYVASLSAWDVRPGMSFVRNMDEGSGKADRIIAILSPSYLESEYCKAEWAAAFRRDPSGEKGTLLPVRVQECDVSGLLSQILYLDLVGLDEETARSTLLDGVRKGRAKPCAAPAYPSAVSQDQQHKPGFPLLGSIWNVPHPRNHCFIGRSELLDRIHSAFSSGTLATNTQVIAGLGGIGKTQLAAEYVYRFAEHYDIVWWINCSDPTTLSADYLGLARVLGIPDTQDLPLVSRVSAIKRQLEKSARWLLVFDNADCPEAVLHYLPRSDRGNTLITSRNSHWSDTALAVPLPVFRRSESTDFLQKRTGTTDDVSLERLAEALGDLPLALAQAGAYIAETGRSVTDYLDLFASRRTELLKLGRPFAGYPDTVATTWDISIRSIEDRSFAAVEILNLCAFLAPDGIPLDLIMAWGPYLPKTIGDPLKLDEAMSILRGFSMIDISGDALFIHRLVQAALIDRLAADAITSWASTILWLMAAFFPFDVEDDSTWRISRRLLPHALAVTDHCLRLGLVSVELALLLDRIGGCLINCAQFEMGKITCQRALEIGEAAFGPEHARLTMVPTTVRLGIAQHKLGDIEGAESVFRAALSLAGSLGESYKVHAGSAAQSLGLLLLDKGDISGAKIALESALDMFDGEDHTSRLGTMIALNDLGLLMRGQGDLSAARQTLERVMGMLESTSQSNHALIGQATNNLGLVLESTGDLEGARDAFDRALEESELAYGPDHPEVAKTLNNIATLLSEMGEPELAKSLVERALKIDESTYGPEHPDFARTLGNFGTILLSLGDLAGAQAAFERSCHIDESVYGSLHPSVAISYNNIGTVLRERGDAVGSKAAYEKALKIDISVHGLSHPNVARTWNNLGVTELALGDPVAAANAFHQALDILSAYLPDSHPWVRTATESLALANGEIVKRGLGRQAGRLANRAVQGKGAKIGRNEQCPCGSGRKYKKCCLGKPGTGL